MNYTALLNGEEDIIDDLNVYNGHNEDALVDRTHRSDNGLDMINYGFAK